MSNRPNFSPNSHPQGGGMQGFRGHGSPHHNQTPGRGGYGGTPGHFNQNRLAFFCLVTVQVVKIKIISLFTVA